MNAIVTPLPMTCQRCHGAGYVFECEEWDRTNRTCCPAGTTQPWCPGKTVRCPICSLNDSMRAIEAEIEEAKNRKTPATQINAMRRKWFEVYERWAGIRFGDAR